MTALYRAIDEAEHFNRINQNPEEHKAETMMEIPDIVIDESTQCNFSLMEKLPGHWNRWTGNVVPNSDISGIVPPKGSTGISKETVKIPFKPSAWQRGANHRPKIPLGANTAGSGTGGDIIDESEAPELAGSSRRSSRHGDAEDEDSVAGNAGKRHFQRAYGTVRFQPHAPSMYWARLSMTESVMSAPDFQHLSSDRFRALEHRWLYD